MSIKIKDIERQLVAYEDHLLIIEKLEYELRYIMEQLNCEKEEKLYWQDMYNELYELTH